MEPPKWTRIYRTVVVVVICSAVDLTVSTIGSRSKMSCHRKIRKPERMQAEYGLDVL